MTARSLALTFNEHWRVYRSVASAGSRYTRLKLCSSRAMLWLRELVADADANTSSFIASLRPANRHSPSCRNCHLASSDWPGARLVVAIAPELTMGLVRPSPLCSMAARELNA